MTTAAICATREVSWRPSFYRGEQYDSDLGLYYLRARYYNPATGRFLSRDPNDPQLLDSNGVPTDPTYLHKYLYANGDPVNGVDRMGREDLIETVKIIAKVVLVVGTVAACGVAVGDLLDTEANAIATRTPPTIGKDIVLVSEVLACGTGLATWPYLLWM